VVAYAGRTCTIACCVRDASTDGARLRVDGAIAVPDTFELFVELDGTWVDCEVVWRHGKDVGVRYTSDVKHGNATRRQVVDAPPVPERALKFPVRRSRP
ncbi:MAG: PilZ domain-containing protein, partial [Hyphomicrobiaceae bacterium]